jgi:hypothetical protein
MLAPAAPPPPLLNVLLFDGAGMTTVDHLDSRPNIGRDAHRLSTHDSTVGKGSIVVGLLWLALIVIAVAPSLIPQPAALASPAKCSLPLADTLRP